MAKLIAVIVVAEFLILFAYPGLATREHHHQPDHSNTIERSPQKGCGKTAKTSSLTPNSGDVQRSSYPAVANLLMQGNGAPQSAEAAGLKGRKTAYCLQCEKLLSRVPRHTSAATEDKYLAYKLKLCVRRCDLCE